MFQYYPHIFFGMNSEFPSNQYPYRRNPAALRNKFFDDFFVPSIFDDEEEEEQQQNTNGKKSLKMENDMRKEANEDEFDEDQEIRYFQHLIKQKKQLNAYRKKQRQEYLERQKLKKQQEMEKLLQIQQCQQIKDNYQKNSNNQLSRSVDKMFDDLFQDFGINQQLKCCENQECQQNNNKNTCFISSSVNKKSFFDENGNKVVITTSSANRNGEKNEKTVKQIFDKNDLTKCIEEQEFSEQSQQQLKNQTKSTESGIIQQKTSQKEDSFEKVENQQQESK